MSVTLPFLRPGAPHGDDAPARGGRRLGRGPLLAVAAGVVAVVVLATWLVAFSPVLGAKTVSVRGLRTLTQAQVRAAAHITRGTPLVRLDTGAVAARVETIPEVASARVSTSFPGTVVITVTERRAVGWVDTGGRAALVDRTGTRFHTVRSAPRGLPHLVLPSGPQADATARAVAAVAAALPPGVLAQLASIQAFDPTAITLLLRDQRVVRWGSADRSADKARILPALLHQPGTLFDVSNPDLVVAR